VTFPQAWGTISLPNLVPERFYQFRVAAYNALGSAPLSNPTEVSIVVAAVSDYAHLCLCHFPMAYLQSALCS
jgi:hypothetical protein